MVRKVGAARQERAGSGFGKLSELGADPAHPLLLFACTTAARAAPSAWLPQDSFPPITSPTLLPLTDCSKSTIDTVYAQLQRAEVEGEAGVHGASTSEVLESLTQVGQPRCCAAVCR